MEDYKKKYEQALDNFKKIKAANKDNKELVDFIEYKYPELKESEDERTREEIIDYCHERLNTTYGALPNIETIKRWLTWLEKQDEPKPAWSEEDKEKIELLIAIFEVNHPNEYFKVNPITTLNMEAMSTEEIVDWLKSLKERMKGE